MYDANEQFHQNYVRTHEKSFYWKYSRYMSANNELVKIKSTKTQHLYFHSLRKPLGLETMQGEPKSSGSGAIDVWIACSRTDHALHSYFDILPAEERAHGMRMGRETARRRYISARILLRLALSHAMRARISPKDWRFRAAANGKPEIAGDCPRLFFSISHNASISLAAVSAASPIGIDLEDLSQPLRGAVVDCVLAAGERERNDGAPSSGKLTDLVRLWTLKEAYSKMLNLGHSLDFSKIEMALRPARLVSDANGAAHGGPVHFETFILDSQEERSHAALAIGLPASGELRGKLRIMLISSRPCEMSGKLLLN